MLLRGCRMRNTRWCYGLVVFAGNDTKLMRNSGKTKLKRTSLDRFLNVLIMGVCKFLFWLNFKAKTLCKISDCALSYCHVFDLLDFMRHLGVGHR